MQQTSALATSNDFGAHSVDQARTHDRVFFSGMALAFAVTVLAGFSRTYYFNGFADNPFPLSPLLHVHAAVYSAWMLLLVVQTALIARNRVTWHRRLGFAGCMIAASMVVLGIAVAVTRTASGITVDRGAPPLVFLAVPLAGMLVFTVLFGAGVLQRHHRPAHKRLVILATLEIVTAAVARLPVVETWGPLGFFGVVDLFVIALVSYDFATLNRVHPATLWGGLFLVLSQPLRLAIGGSTAWIGFATWLTSA